MKKLFFVLAFLLIPVLCFAGTKTLTFQWDSNTEEDIVGYRIYKGSAVGGPYSKIGDIPHVPGTTQTSPANIVVPDGEDTTLYFVVTAYDLSGNESGYSNEVSAKIDFKPPANPHTFIIKVVTSP
jgi:hypothetical protein